VFFLPLSIKNPKSTIITHQSIRHRQTGPPPGKAEPQLGEASPTRQAGAWRSQATSKKIEIPVTFARLAANNR
jgi:hypothetical protein